MKKIFLLLALVLCWGLLAIAQEQPAPSQGGMTPAAPADQSAGKAAKTSHMKGSSIKGCLGGSEGNYTLMHGKKTYNVSGDTAQLKEHVGHEVKLMGTKEGDTFNMTSVKHISDTCTASGKHHKGAKAGAAAGPGTSAPEQGEGNVPK